MTRWIRILALKQKRRKARREIPLLRARLRDEGLSDAEAALPIVAAAQEVEAIDAEIGKIRTGRFVLKAILLGIDPLENTKEWFYTRMVKSGPNQTTSVSTLTRLGDAKMRRNIQIEKRARWEFWLKLIPPILTAITGVLGTLIGILALLFR